jgi:hypothetical protein
VVCSRVRELHETISAGMIALETSRNSRVAALQKRWDLLVRDYQGEDADRLVARIAPAVVSPVAELRAATGAISLERRSAPVSDNTGFYAVIGNSAVYRPRSLSPAHHELHPSDLATSRQQRPQSQVPARLSTANGFLHGLIAVRLTASQG